MVVGDKSVRHLRIRDDVLGATSHPSVAYMYLTHYSWKKTQEILAGQVPFKLTHTEDEIRFKIVSGERPARIPARQPDAIWNVITRFWAHEPNYRPTSHEALVLIRDAITQEKGKSAFALVL